MIWEKEYKSEKSIANSGNDEELMEGAEIWYEASRDKLSDVKGVQCRFYSDKDSLK